MVSNFENVLKFAYFKKWFFKKHFDHFKPCFFKNAIQYCERLASFRYKLNATELQKVIWSVKKRIAEVKKRKL